MPRTEQEIQNDIDNLDIPILMISDALQITGDHFDIPVLEFLDRYEAGTTPKFGDEAVMASLLDCALESSFQIAHIRNAILLDEEISRL
jgi:hypothetical protein